MSWMDGLRERLRPLLDRDALEAEMDEELGFHFQREVDRNLEAGMSPREARRAARASMGGAVHPPRYVRAEWKGIELGGLGQELRLALRRLARRPGFVTAAVLTLALGIGANTAIFSLVRSVLVRPLPYADAHRLALIWNSDRDTETWLSAREWVEYRRASSTFASLGAYTDFELSLTEDAEPERVLAAAVTANVFPILGTRPHLGRLFTPDDDLPGAAGVAVLSADLWQRRYGGDPDVVGRTITASGRRFEVVGILPPGFRLPLDYRLRHPTELFIPGAIDETADLQWGNRGWTVFGRLDTAVAAGAATAEVRAIGARWIEQGLIPDDSRFTRDAVPLDEFLLSNMRPPLMLLMGAVGFILLIACANVAHLLLARADARRSEVAVAAALGASRPRLVRQFLVENGLLAGLGTVLGIGLAALALRVAVSVTPVNVIRMRGVELDLAVLLFAAGLTIATTLLAGLVPALRLSRVDLSSAIGATRGVDRSGVRHRARRLLIAGETALSVVLVIGAALLGRSFMELNRLELGFDDSDVLTFGISLPQADYPETGQVVGFVRELEDRVETLPGVESVGAARLLPLGGSIGSWTITLEEPLADPEQGIEPDWQIVTPGYLETLDLELRAGRFLSEVDRIDAPLVAMISEMMAARYWPGESALGKRFHLGTLDQPWIEIVGVLGSVRHNAIVEEPRIEMYLPHAQWPVMRGDGFPQRTMSIVVRTAGNPLEVLPAVRRVVSELDASLPLADPRPMADITAEALAEQRFTVGLLGVFAVLALVLAAIGLYGVTSYSTTRRTNELGIRLALGAGRLDVAGLVMREALGMAALGIALGGLGALGLTRFLANQLYEISPLDPATFLVVPVLLLAVAGLASYLPARRAARVDPVTALRQD